MSDQQQTTDPVMRLYDRKGRVRVWVCPECATKLRTKAEDPPTCRRVTRFHVQWGKRAA